MGIWAGTTTAECLKLRRSLAAQLLYQLLVGIPDNVLQLVEAGA